MDVQISDSATAAFYGASGSIGLTPPPPPVQIATPSVPLAPIDSDTPTLSALPVSSAGSGDPGSTADQRGGRPLHVASSLGDTAGILYHSPRPLSVEFHATNQPNEILTILRDPSTGQVYAEFPSDAVVRLAEFFNHLAGFVVDQKA